MSIISLCLHFSPAIRGAWRGLGRSDGWVWNWNIYSFIYLLDYVQMGGGVFMLALFHSQLGSRKRESHPITGSTKHTSFSHVGPCLLSRFPAGPTPIITLRPSLRAAAIVYNFFTLVSSMYVLPPCPFYLSFALSKK